MDDQTLATLIDRLDAIEERLDRLEQGAKTPVPQSVAPPVIQTRPVPYVVPRAVPVELGPLVTKEAEYFWGAKVLPRVGATVLIAMFAYFVSIAYDKGWIGPSTIFGGAALLCVLLIGLGQWRRNEREEYGQILTGVGSCGLYLDFAAGHLFQHLYSAEIMVGLFVTWSFVNLAYGLWQTSRAFLAIGVVGGFAGALMPLDHNLTATSAGLFFLILATASIVVAVRKWTDAALGVGVVAALVAGVISAQKGVTWPQNALLLESSTLVSLVVFQWTLREKKNIDLWSVAIAVAASLISMTLAVLRFDRPSALNFAGYGLVFAATGLLATDRSTRLTTYVCGAAMVFFVAPFALGGALALNVLLACAALLSIGAVIYRDKIEVFSFWVVQSVLALSQYVYLANGKMLPRGTEWLYLFVALAIFAVGSVASRKHGDEAEALPIALLASVVARMAYLAVLLTQVLEPNYSITAALLVGSIAALSLGFWRDSMWGRLLGLGAFGVTTTKLVFDLTTAAPFVRVGLLFAVGVALLAGGYWYIRRADMTREA